MLPLPEGDVSVPELGSKSLVGGGSSGGFKCLTISRSMGSNNVCGLVNTVANLLGKGLSGEGSLRADQVNERAVAGIRGKLTSHAKLLTPLTSLGASGDLDSSNVSSMPTTRS